MALAIDPKGYALLLRSIDGLDRGSRERAVPCQGCWPKTGQTTRADNALCDRCQSEAEASLGFGDEPAALGLEWA